MHEISSFAFLDIGTPELLLIMFVALLLFGGKKLPELAKGMGKAVREFKDATAGVEAEVKRAMDPPAEEAKRPVASSGAGSSSNAEGNAARLSSGSPTVHPAAALKD